MQRIIIFLLTGFLMGGVCLPHAGAISSEDKDVPPGPGNWELFCRMDNQLFPSAVITMAPIKPETLGIEKDKTTFGSPLAMATVFIRGRAPGDKVRVEISSTRLIHPSRMEAILEDPDQIYQINPHLKYEYEKLLSIRQPYPEDITAKVYLNGQFLGEQTHTMVIRSINDCLYGVINDDGSVVDLSYMFAAYVNEGDPLIDGILSEALKKGYVDAFDGYQSDLSQVMDQIAAIWQVLQDRGLRYSNITTTSVESDSVMAQHVRLVGDSARAGQANCADGSVLFASVFRKIGLNAFLLSLPSHMMVGVGLDFNNSSTAYIETTMVAGSTIDQAMMAGQATLNRYDVSQTTLVDINQARKAGFLPLRDINRSRRPPRPREKGDL